MIFLIFEIRESCRMHKKDLKLMMSAGRLVKCKMENVICD